jgi:hypothetical protein
MYLVEKMKLEKINKDQQMDESLNQVDGFYDDQLGGELPSYEESQTHNVPMN